MTKTVLGIIILSGLILTTTACKKKNLTRDQWIITEATDLEDGSNITADYSGEVWEYAKDGNYIENANVKGSWAFGDGKEKLIITETDGSIDTYNVLKLKKNVMWLEIPLEEEIHLSRLK
ncbi:hypothetical protein JYT74_03910 [Crocinitomix catalasitica]|nr:hypothetical protein [Crocinitomix catalasitica]